MKTNLFLAAVMVAASFPASAFGQSSDEPRKVAVTYADLNLASEAGRHSLESRISGAVKRVCGQPANVSLRQAAEGRHCKRRASATAHSQARLVVARTHLPGAALAGR